MINAILKLEVIGGPFLRRDNYSSKYCIGVASTVKACPAMVAGVAIWQLRNSTRVPYLFGSAEARQHRSFRKLKLE